MYRQRQHLHHRLLLHISHYRSLKFLLKKLLKPSDIVEYTSYVTFRKDVWFIIEDVYKGTKYEDTCISKIVINGIYSPSAYDGPD